MPTWNPFTSPASPKNHFNVQAWNNPFTSPANPKKAPHYSTDYSTITSLIQHVTSCGGLRQPSRLCPFSLQLEYVTNLHCFFYFYFLSPGCLVAREEELLWELYVPIACCPG